MWCGQCKRTVDTIHHCEFRNMEQASKEQVSKMNELENVTVQLKVNLSLIMTLGLYNGPITKKIIAENVKDTIDVYVSDGDDFEGLIDSVEILEILHDEEEMIDLNFQQ